MMNARRQEEKYDELLRCKSCWVLHEEAETFRTLLQVKGIQFKTCTEHDYLTKFTREAFK